MSDMITGDAVVVELRIARLASRAVAFSLDLAVMGTGFVILLLIASATGTLTADDALTATIAVVVMVTAFVIYPVTIETLTRGRSLGKMAMGLRVVREDGGPIRFRHALVRGLAGFVLDFGIFSMFTGAIGLITSLISAKGRRIGDMLAGTVVVRERVPVERQVVIGMPLALAGWATTLTLSHLPDQLALSARQFLQRTGQLDPAVRASLGHSLAAQVAAHVAPAPPPGTPPEAFLAAVLAERSRRELARMAAERTPTTQPPPPPPLPQPQPQPRADPPDEGFALPR
jgi:uncharacterized RDD family membrane protein YckC